MINSPVQRNARPSVRRWWVLYLVAIAGFTALIVHVIVTSGAPGKPKPGTVDALKPVTAPDSTITPVVHVTAAQAAGALSMPWKLTAANASSKVIGIYYSLGPGAGCIDLRGMYVKETATSVLIDVAAKQSGSGPCTAILRLGRSDITLERPLGKRDLLHAVVSSGWQDVDF